MALITTTDELRTYLAADANTQIATLAPYIAEAERRYIVPLLGNELYVALKEELEETTPAARFTDLLPCVQRPLAHYSYYLAFPHLIANLGEKGLRVAQTDSSYSAPKWMHDQVAASLLQNADAAADALLEYLEEEADTWPEWVAGEGYTLGEGLLLHSVELADRYIDISGSRRIFLKLKKYIAAVERKVIRARICQDEYDELATALKDGTLTEEQESLLDMIRPAVAKMALHQALPGMRVQITPDGVYMLGSNDGTVSKAAAGKDELAAYRETLRTGFSGYESDLEELEQFINDNIDDYPLIKASPCYTVAPDPGPKWMPENDSSNKHFSI
jgi:hypothetical protein